jgi:hypothetical protein
MLAVVKKYKMNIYGASSFRYCYKFLPKTRRAMHVNYTINPPTNPLDLHNSAGNKSTYQQGFQTKMRINQVLLLGVVLLVISSSGTTEKSCMLPYFLDLVTELVPIILLNYFNHAHVETGRHGVECGVGWRRSSP